MLILTRKPGESIAIGNEIRINIFEVDGSNVRVGIQAPKSVTIYRGEIYEKVQEENKDAARLGVNVDFTILANSLHQNIKIISQDLEEVQSDE